MHRYQQRFFHCVLFSAKNWVGRLARAETASLTSGICSNTIPGKRVSARHTQSFTP